MDGKNYIFGFDPSISCVGISVFDFDGNPVLVGSIETKKSDTTGKRLRDIADFLLKLREEYTPSAVVIERAFSRFNNSTAAIYRVHGVINLLFWDIVQIYYPPKDIKATILKGTATKKDLQDKIKTIYSNIEFKNEDESDAFAVSLSYLIKNKVIDWKK